MSVTAAKIIEEIKHLSEKEQAELAAFLFHLRHKADPEYQATVDRRVGDKDPSHWLTPEEFEKRLDHN